MAQELISKRIAIIGAGPAGCCCAYFLQNSGADIYLFDKGKFLRTILPTGGGRCNLANGIYDFKELAKNYPRGEKFLYSLFSKFSTYETIEFFKSIGINTYTQNDNRIFPESNSSIDVREKMLKAIKCNFIKENVIDIENKTNFYKIITEKSSYSFDYVVVAIGGHGDYSILNKLDINIIEPVQALVGFVCEQDFSTIAGVSIKNIYAQVDKQKFYGDILFTHKGISGPLIYKISSVFARKQMPYTIKFKFVEDFDFQNLLNINSNKDIKNLLSQFCPQSFITFLLNYLSIDPKLKCHQINKNLREKIYNGITNFEIKVNSKVTDGEIVTCGGIDLKEINSKTCESKKYSNLYFCGEVLDIDGFCGGFNLQNCWSSGYIVADAIKNKLKNTL